MFKLLGLPVTDAATCVADVGGASAALRDFAHDFKAHNASLALTELNAFLTSLATSVGGCDVESAATKIDALISALHIANISISKATGAVDKIIIGVSDISNDITALANAVSSDDTGAMGAAIASLINDWNTVSGGCADTDKACKLVEGLLRLTGSVATHWAPCEAALKSTYDDIAEGFNDFHDPTKNNSAAVKAIAKGLDSLAADLGTSACDLQDVAEKISAVAPRLAGAIANATHVIIGATNVYDELYNAAMDLASGDITGFGMQIGRLIAALKATSCDTEMCTVLDGILEALALEAADYASCSKDIDAVMSDLESAVYRFRSAKTDGLSNFEYGVQDLAQALVALAHAVGDCGIADLSTLLESTASQLGLNHTVGVIGEVEQLLVNGADITLNIASIVTDAENGRWKGLGADLSALALKLNSTDGFKCKSFVCRVVDGMLTSLGLALQDMGACESALTLAEGDFTSGATLWRTGDIKGAVKDWSSGLNVIAHAITDDSGCGIAKQLGLLAHEANALGLANVTILKDAEKIAKIVLHGASFEEDLFAALTAFENHDARGAGTALGKVLDTLTQWTTGKGCDSSNACFVLEGIITLVADGAGSFKQCEADIKETWGNISAAFKEFDDGKSFWHFKHNRDAIRAGVRDLGNAMHDLARSVTDCHLQEIADLLLKLATKLGLAPEISWIEEVLHILIEGVHIENEIGDACDDYSNKNYIGFGYNVAKLVYTLVE
jgi:uncharacterized protein YukE